jgi:hypothetical protein
MRIRRGRRAREMALRKHNIEGAVQRYRQLWETCITQRDIVWPTRATVRARLSLTSSLVLSFRRPFRVHQWRRMSLATDAS